MSLRRTLLTAITVASLVPLAAVLTPTAATAAATAGCGRTPTLANGTNTIQSSGKTRSFIVRIPSGYDNRRPYRLVFGFHWRGGTATDVATGQTVQRDVWSYYGLQRLAGESTIFVAPQGIGNGWANSGGEDVTFVDDMLRRIEGDLCVETTQRFALGFSYGGAMSFSLACSRPDVFRAVAVYSGGRLSGCSGGTQPIAYFAAHGLRDGVLNISGGRSMRDQFVRNNGCTAQNPPEPAQGSLTHRTTTYSGCASGRPVTWAAFDEGHIAAPQDGASGDSGSRTWLPAETWRFFTQFGGSGGNLLTNGSMENGATGWTTSGGTLSSATPAYAGSRSLLNTGRTAAWQGPNQNVTSQLTNGKSYTTSVWVRSQSGTPSAKATLALTANGTTNYLQLTPAQAVNTGGWTRLTGTTTVSWTGTLTNASFYAETVAGTDGFYIDDASFQ
ncbi:carbohydrate binding domain-containing protein [Herbidospora daliensis]|uniref:carbohydrate binding domain-containing protein n=1 Tax=Herbidospora daliensis TaxID=295585 RepID=UPI0009FD5F4A|nr:carbohydrate binding domain-containing protein [Herbidospora daliensis]